MPTLATHIPNMLTFNHWHWFIFFLLRGSTRVWTQDLAYAKQVLYLLRSTSNSFCFIYFLGKVSCLCLEQLGWQPYLKFQCIWYDSWPSPHPVFIAWDEISQTFCLDWQGTVILPISAFQVSRIHGAPYSSNSYLYKCKTGPTFSTFREFMCITKKHPLWIDKIVNTSILSEDVVHFRVQTWVSLGRSDFWPLLQALSQASLFRTQLAQPHVSALMGTWMWPHYLGYNNL
jgi:hypothetical protein